MLLAIAGMMIFASCKKDETPAPLTKEEATIELTSIEENYLTDIEGYETSEAAQAMSFAENLDLSFSNDLKKAPINNKESFQKSIVKTYYSFLAKENSDESLLDFDFENNVGTWNKVNGEWVRTPDQTNKIVVIFSFKGGTKNGTLTFYDYAKKTISFDGENETYMSNLSSKVEIVGMVNPVATRKYTANLSYSSTSMKMSFKFDYTLGIYSSTTSFALEGNRSGGTISVLNEIKKSDDIIRSTSFTMKLTDIQTGSLIVDAKYRIKDIIIKWAININSTTNFDGNPSDFQNISVWTAGGAKVADVIFRSEEGEWIPYFKFADNSEVIVSVFFSEQLMDNIFDFNDTLFYFNFK